MIHRHFGDATFSLAFLSFLLDLQKNFVGLESFLSEKDIDYFGRVNVFGAVTFPIYLTLLIDNFS